MKINLEKNLELPVSAARAWDLLEDIQSVTACLPGARITERVDDSHYRGAVTIRLGPASVTFNGLIEIAERDAAARRMRIVGSGSDAGGGSAASLNLIASIEERDANNSTLNGHSEVSVNGKIASFGARLMNSASDVLIKQFFDNMRARASVAPTTADVASLAGAGSSDLLRNQEASTPAARPNDPSVDGFSFIWAVVRDYFLKLFGGSAKS
jgi:uncharacterized protein